MTTLHSIPGEAVAWREVDGEFVLISVETTHYYSLNASGSDVWRILLEGPQTADSIAGALAAGRGLDRREVGAQVQALLEHLRGEGLLRRRGRQAIRHRSRARRPTPATVATSRRASSSTRRSSS